MFCVCAARTGALGLFYQATRCVEQSLTAEDEYLSVDHQFLRLLGSVVDILNVRCRLLAMNVEYDTTASRSRLRISIRNLT